MRMRVDFGNTNHLRTKGKMRKLELIDFLRGYSIFTIVLFHAFQNLPFAFPLNGIFAFGGTGVHLFNVLSGFGLFYSYLAKPTSFPDFLVHRGAKIYLPYIITIAIYVIAFSFLLPGYNLDWYAIGGHVFLYKMFDNSIMESVGYQFWYISTIIQFYLFFHVIVALRKRIPPKAFLPLCLATSIGWSLLVLLLNKGDYRIWSNFFLQYLWEFALGMAIAERVFRKQPLFRINTPTCFALGLAGMIIYGALGLFGGNTGKLLNDIPALLGYSLIAIGIYQINIPKLNAIIQNAGAFSFSVFLVHVLWIEVIYSNFSTMHLLARSAMVFIGTYGSAFLLHHTLLKLQKPRPSPKPNLTKREILDTQA